MTILFIFLEIISYLLALASPVLTLLCVSEKIPLLVLPISIFIHFLICLIALRYTKNENRQILLQLSWTSTGLCSFFCLMNLPSQGPNNHLMWVVLGFSFILQNIFILILKPLLLRDTRHHMGLFLVLPTALVLALTLNYSTIDFSTTESHKSTILMKLKFGKALIDSIPNEYLEGFIISSKDPNSGQIYEYKTSKGILGLSTIVGEKLTDEYSALTKEDMDAKAKKLIENMQSYNGRRNDAILHLETYIGILIIFLYISTSIALIFIWKTNPMMQRRKTN